MLKYLTMWAGIAVTVGSGYRLEEWCLIPSGSDRDFSLSLHPSWQWGCPCLCPFRLGPPNTDNKSVWNSTATLTYMKWCGIKEQLMALITKPELFLPFP